MKTNIIIFLLLICDCFMIAKYVNQRKANTKAMKVLEYAVVKDSLFHIYMRDRDSAKYYKAIDKITKRQVALTK